MAFFPDTQAMNKLTSALCAAQLGDYVHLIGCGDGDNEATGTARLLGVDPGTVALPSDCRGLVTARMEEALLARYDQKGRGFGSN